MQLVVNMIMFSSDWLFLTHYSILILFPNCGFHCNLFLFWSQFKKCKNNKQIKKYHLVEDEWALQAAFAGSICQQVGLHLLQAGQHWATGTAHRKTLVWEKTGCAVVEHTEFPLSIWIKNNWKDLL